jgi:hypothetical protein
MSFFFEKGKKKFEKFYDLDNDPTLLHNDIQIGARVTVKNGTPQNRIVFSSPYQEEEVRCTHTVIAEYTLEELPDEKEIVLNHLTPSSLKLPPEEHFFALNSYVQGIVKIGLQNIMIASYHSEKFNPETLPFGFNAMMHRQIIRCLTELCPEQAKLIIDNMFAELNDAVSEEWMESHYEFLEDMYNIGKINAKVRLAELRQLKEEMYSYFKEDYELVVNLWATDVLSVIDTDKLVSIVKLECKKQFDNIKTLKQIINIKEFCKIIRGRATKSKIKLVKQKYPFLDNVPIINYHRGVLPRKPGNPVSPIEGWAVRRKGWLFYKEKSVKKDENGLFWWETIPLEFKKKERFIEKMYSLLNSGNTEMLRAIEKVMKAETDGTDNPFYTSIREQAIRWGTAQKSKYKRPLTDKQVDAVLYPPWEKKY